MAEMERQLNELKQLVNPNEKKGREEKKQENFKTGPRKRIAHQPCKSHLSLVAMVTVILVGGATMPTTKRVRNMGVVDDDSCDTERYTGLRIKYVVIYFNIIIILCSFN